MAASPVILHSLSGCSSWWQDRGWGTPILEMVWVRPRGGASVRHLFSRDGSDGGCHLAPEMPPYSTPVKLTFILYLHSHILVGF